MTQNLLSLLVKKKKRVEFLNYWSKNNILRVILEHVQKSFI